MGISNVIPIPREIASAYELDLAVDDGQLRMDHFYSPAPDGGIAVLTTLFYIKPEEWQTVFFYSEFDRDGALDRQVELRDLAQLVWTTHKLFPRCITFSPDGTLLVGCSSNVLMATPNYQNAIYAADVSNGATTAYPRLGSLVAFAEDGRLVTTLHHNGEVRLPLPADDALAISAAPNPKLPAEGHGGDGLAPAMKLLASLSEQCFVEFPMLDHQPGTAEGLTALQKVISKKCGLQIRSARIYSLLALDAGRILCLMWDSAQNVISHTFAVIYSPQGQILDIVVDDVTKTTQMQWNDRTRELISLSDGIIAVRDRLGKTLGTSKLYPTQASTLKGYDLSGVTSDGCPILTSNRKKATNAFFIASSLEEHVLGEELAAHKKWLTAAKKAHSPVNFRWTDALVPG